MDEDEPQRSRQHHSRRSITRYTGRCRYRPLHLSLTACRGSGSANADAITDYISISTAFARSGPLDTSWQAQQRAVQQRLDRVIQSLAGQTVPGSIAGTHARLMTAAALVAGCEADYQFMLPYEIENRSSTGSGLFCINETETGLALSEIDHAIRDLGG